MGYILGSVSGGEPTSEMLSRTHPNLYDLFVAVAAGFAGAYAIVDEKISPALPGVAIATAIVPPLANTGLCLSLGEIDGAIGSFLLFFANFLSILLVDSLTFLLSGMTKYYRGRNKRNAFTRHFILPVIAFIFIFVYLGRSLIKIIKTIQTTLRNELSILPSTFLREVNHYIESEKIHVMTNVLTPTFLTTSQVTVIQNK